MSSWRSNRGFVQLKIRLNSPIRLILGPKVWMFEKPKIWMDLFNKVRIFEHMKIHIYEPNISLVAVCTYRLVMISIKWSETTQKNALASTDVIVTQLLHCHMPLFYFVCNHLIGLIIPVLNCAKA